MKRLLLVGLLSLVCYAGAASNAGAGPPGFACTAAMGGWGYPVTTQIFQWAPGLWIQEIWRCYYPNGWWGPYYYDYYGGGGGTPMGVTPDAS